MKLAEILAVLVKGENPDGDYDYPVNIHFDGRIFSKSNLKDIPYKFINFDVISINPRKMLGSEGWQIGYDIDLKNGTGDFIPKWSDDYIKKEQNIQEET